MNDDTVLVHRDQIAKLNAEIVELRKYKALEGTHDRIKLIAKYAAKAFDLDYMEIAPSDLLEAIVALRNEHDTSLEVLQTAYAPTPNGSAPLHVLARWAAIEVLELRALLGTKETP